MIETKFHETTNGLVIERVQDCEPILKACKEKNNHRINQGKDIKLAASIPSVLVEKYINDKGITFSEFINNQAHIRTILNDPDLAYFRIWQGRV